MKKILLKVLANIPLNELEYNIKFSNIINGNIINRLSNAIFIRKENFLMKKILLKVLANIPLNELEYNIFFKKLK